MEVTPHPARDGWGERLARSTFGRRKTQFLRAWARSRKRKRSGTVSSMRESLGAYVVGTCTGD